MSERIAYIRVGKSRDECSRGELTSLCVGQRGYRSNLADLSAYACAQTIGSRARTVATSFQRCVLSVIGFIDVSHWQIGYAAFHLWNSAVPPEQSSKPCRMGL